MGGGGVGGGESSESCLVGTLGYFGQWNCIFICKNLSRGPQRDPGPRLEKTPQTGFHLAAVPDTHPPPSGIRRSPPLKNNPRASTSPPPHKKNQKSFHLTPVLLLFYSSYTSFSNSITFSGLASGVYQEKPPTSPHFPPPPPTPGGYLTTSVGQGAPTTSHSQLLGK